MAIPAASVKIEILKILGIPAVALGAGNTRYARVYFQAGAAPQLTTGRSRPIPAAGGDFDVTPEADAAPPAPAPLSGTVADPWTQAPVPLVRVREWRSGSPRPGYD